MAGYDGAGLIHLRGLRLTKLDSDGSPLSGVNNAYVTNAVSTMAQGLTMSENEAITQLDGRGTTRYSYRADDTLTEGVIDALTIINADPHLLDFLLGFDVLYSVNEAQTLTITGTPTGGTVTLTFDGGSVAVDYDATSTEVQTALLTLAAFDTGDVTTSGGPLPATPVVITFGGKYAKTDVALITVDDAGLTGGTIPAATVTTTTSATAGDSLGHRANAIGAVPLPNGVAIEGVENAIIGNALAGVRPFMHNVWPRCKLRITENRTLGAEGFSNLILAGVIQENPNFGTGPLGDIAFPTNRVHQQYRITTDFTSTPGFLTVA